MISCDSSSPIQNLQRALEDVGELLVLVRVLGHDASLLEIDVREHHPVAGDEPAVEQRRHGLARNWSHAYQVTERAFETEAMRVL